MAVRAPLYLDGSNDLQEMTTAEVLQWTQYMCYLYGTSPSVVLSVVGSSGSLAAMSDTRLQAGATSTHASAFVAEDATAEPSTVTVSYDKITQTNNSVSPTSDSGTTFPVYYTGSDIQAMPLADVKDTWLQPAIDLLTANSDNQHTAGTYTIHTGTSLTNFTNVSTTPVFIDTRANTGAYSAAGIPETLDQPTTITNYYLHRRNAVDPGWSNLKTPLYIDGDNNLRQYAEADFDSLFLQWIREVASEDTSETYRINYTVGTSGGGYTRGTAMTDTKLNGSGNYQTLQAAGVDDYRSQEFPNGSAATISTYNLRIIKN